MNRNVIKGPLDIVRPNIMPPLTTLELFIGCGGLTTGFEMAGLDRDCYVIAGTQTRLSLVRPGGLSDFSNIMNADDRDLFQEKYKQYKE